MELFLLAILFALFYLVNKLSSRSPKDSTYSKEDRELIEKEVDNIFARYKKNASLPPQDSTVQPPVEISTYYHIDEYFIANNKKSYLASHEWKKIVQQIHTRDKVCQACRYTDQLEVHHITYERFMHEELPDLVLLCGNRYDENGEYLEGCHQKLHNAAKKIYKDFSYEYKYPLKLLEKSSK